MGRGGSFEVVDGGNGARGMNRHGQRCLPNGTCWPLLGIRLTTLDTRKALLKTGQT